MPDSPSDKPQPADALQPAPAGEDTLEVLSDDDMYAIAEPQPAPAAAPAAGGPSAEPAWYMTHAGGPQQGPFDLAEMERRVRSGELREADLVWQEGMPAWAAARGVPELFGVAPAPQPVQPAVAPAPQPVVAQTPPPLTARPPARPSFEVGKIVAPLDQFLARPAVFRAIGYISGGLALVTLSVSLVAWFWGHTWFDRALLFAAIFFLCVGTAAVLEAIQRTKGKPTFKE